jgi:hypothetical protein
MHLYARQALSRTGSADEDRPSQSFGWQPVLCVYDLLLVLGAPADQTARFRPHRSTWMRVQQDANLYGWAFKLMHAPFCRVGQPVSKETLILAACPDLRHCSP